MKQSARFLDRSDELPLAAVFSAYAGPDLRRLLLGMSGALWCLAAGPELFAQGNEPGKPWPRHTIDASSRGADGVQLADVNRDGKMDVVTGWEEGGVVRVYTQPERKRVKEPWPAVTVGRVASPEDAVLVDLDGDGALDVVSSCEGRTRSVFVHWAPRRAEEFTNPRSWSVEAFPAVHGSVMWMYAVSAQIDHQHGLDLVLGGKGAGAVIGWLRAPARARDVGAWTFHPLRDAGWIMSLFCIDLDRDGALDIVFSDRKGAGSGVFCIQHPGAGVTETNAVWPLHRIGAAGCEVMFVDVADVNGDKRLDVIAAVKPRRVALMIQPPDIRLTWGEQWLELPPSVGTAKAVVVGDINCDGNLDVVFSCEEAKGDTLGVVWFELAAFASGKTTPVPVRNISGEAGTKFDRLELVDLDADGDLDVITTEEAERLGVIWYENPTK